MKKILNILLILLFVSTLFIGCPPRVPNPPIITNDTIGDTITNPYDSIEYDSIEKYVSIEYLDNYLPNEVGDTFLFTAIKNGILDTILLQLTHNYINKSIFCLAPSRFLSFVDDDYDHIFYWDNISKFVCYESKDIYINFNIFTSIHSDKNVDLGGVDYNSDFYNKNNNILFSGQKGCDCIVKDCIYNTCFPTTITINRDDSLFVEVEHGRGLTIFRDDEGNYWHLVE